MPIKKLSKSQHEEMSYAYRAFLRNYSYSPRPFPQVQRAAKALKGKGLIASASVGGGYIHTGLTPKGLRYCNHWFAAQIIAVL